jgi:hypothetical protein
MTKCSFVDCRDAGHTFLLYQGRQPAGLPTSKNALKECYENYVLLTPGEARPPFQQVLDTLYRAHIISSKNGVLRYLRKFAIDHTIASRQGSEFYCDLCHVSCTSQSSLEDHFSGRAHKARGRVREVTLSVEENEKDKGGIKISKPEFGVLQVGAVVPRNFTISNNGRSRRTLLTCEFVKKVTNLKLDDSQHVTSGMRSHAIPAGGSYHINLTCHATTLGYIRDVLIFRFEGFNIYRYITIYVDAPGSEVLAPIAPYHRPPPVHREDPSEIIPGEQLQRPLQKNKHKKLLGYEIPGKLVGDLNNNNPPALGPLNPDSYKKFFSTLLFIEEIQMNVDIRQYDTNASLVHFNSYYILRVPGLAENRPSVLKGDSVFVRVNKLEYEGIVHQVRLNEVHLRFARRFQSEYRPGESYPVYLGVRLI